MALNDISNRMTPSVPIEITFGAQALAVGRKFTTLFAHMSASGFTATPYQVYSVVNVGDPVAAANEVGALAGVGSQASLMAAAFVKANSAAGRSSFPAFRMVFLPSTRADFGPNQEAINAVKNLRSDMLVSCYPSSDNTNKATLLALRSLISGNDRDAVGQFGSFVLLGSLDSLAAQIAYADDSQGLIEAALPDSNTASVPALGTTVENSPNVSAMSQAALSRTGDVASGSATILNMSSVAGIYPGAAITGTDIPANTTVEQIIGTSLLISNAASGTAAGDSLTITNLPTAGIHPGAAVSGTGIPANTKVLQVSASGVVLSLNATASGSGVALTFQNKVSQASEIVAAAVAASIMQSAVPYNPLANVVVGGLVAPQKSSDWIQVDPSGDSESALQGGLCPLVVQNGAVALLRTRTTYTTGPNSVPITSYFDWQDLVILNDYRESLYLMSQQPPFNNNPGGSKSSATLAVKFNSNAIQVAKQFEEAGMFQGVAQLAKYFQTVPSVSSPGRFDCQFPVNVLPGLNVIAVNVVAVTTFTI